MNNPAELLENHFTEVYTMRMQDVPIVNPKLAVKALGFDRWQGHWLGVLLTPWFMNVILFPEDQTDADGINVGECRTYALPAGSFEFVLNREPTLGAYYTCSLMSPVTELDTLEDALAVARESLTAVMTSPKDAAPEPGEPSEIDSGKRAFLRRFVASNDQNTPPGLRE